MHHVPLEGFSTVYSFYAVLAGYEGEKWGVLTTKAAEDEVLSLRDSDGRTVMHWAAGDGGTRAKLAGVIAARDAGLVNTPNNDGCTPLHDAMWFGCEAVAQALLAAGADTKAQDREGCTPLYFEQRWNDAALVAVLS